MEKADRYRYRCRHLKLIPFHLLSQLDLTRFWDRVLRRAGIPVAFSQGFNPRPQLSFGPATATGVVSRAEYLDITLREPYEPNQLQELINGQIPAGMKVVQIELVSLEAPSIIKALRGIQYTYVFPRDTDLIQLDLEDIEVLERTLQPNNEFMISFLFTGKNILYNPFKLIEMIPTELKWGNPLRIMKEECIW